MLSLALLICCYLLSGFVSTQISLPAIEQVPIRLIIAGFLAIPLISPQGLKALSLRSLLLCSLTSASGYLLAAWAFSDAIILGGYGVAVFVTSLPWLGLFDLILNRSKVSQSDIRSLVISAFGGCVFFTPTILSGATNQNTCAIIYWSLIASISGTFAQYARRLHPPEVKHEVVADGVIISATIQALLLIPTIAHSPTLSDWTWLVCGGLCYLLSNRIANRVFAEVKPTEAAIWMSLEPVVALILSGFFLGATPDCYQVVGSLLLCLANERAIGWLTWGRSRDARARN